MTPDKGNPPKVKDWKRTLHRIWVYLASHKRLLWTILLMVLVSSLFGLLAPFLLGLAIDRLVLTGVEGSLTWLLILLGGSYALYSLTIWLQNYWMIGVAQQSVYRMREDLFGQLHRLPVSFFSRRQHGELMSRLTNDIENVSQTLNTSFIQLTSSLLTFVGMLGLMLYLSPLLTLITLSVVPLMYIGMKWITARTNRYFKEQQRNLGELNGFVEETLSGQRVVTTLSQEQKVIAGFEERNARLRVSGYWAQTYTGFIPKLMNMLNNVSFAVIAGAGGIMVIQSMISIGVIVTFTEYARQFTRPLNDLANQFNTFLSAIAGAERVFEIIDEGAEEEDEREAGELAGVQGEIIFDRVTFSYEEGHPILSDVSFRAAPGETVAFVGPTGAGKTTVIQLLSRFYDPDSGTIAIDGREIGDVKRASLRSHIGYVLQDTFLFAGTIRDNIRYGRLDALDEEVEAAARMANAHTFITKLPQGYDTVLDPEGGSISQGQRQLLSIARAVLADPSILILDEATSSIDTVTEIKIQEALYRLMQGRTSIVIAHRLNTIRQADQIIVLEQGRIIEQGSHRELLGQRGFYYGLVHAREPETAGAR
ncbi:ABC transporter ATP-binding protein [Paenibacillus daejeonensis]|uniref:ABC transporter ATP-binding protein n=1 Tax=Paenibacillus daejeonensis TaxID=135193 RepID=UPI000368CCE6|nr:ABC transporter ATP-binding protein [Paenibacillus daejeonensis]